MRRHGVDRSESRNPLRGLITREGGLRTSARRPQCQSKCICLAVPCDSDIRRRNIRPLRNLIDGLDDRSHLLALLPRLAHGIRRERHLDLNPVRARYRLRHGFPHRFARCPRPAGPPAGTNPPRVALEPIPRTDSRSRGARRVVGNGGVLSGRGDGMKQTAGARSICSSPPPRLPHRAFTGNGPLPGYDVHLNRRRPCGFSRPRASFRERISRSS